ncbi:hypothetical protein [Candidatus Thalassolituus haligoni]|jgi:alkyl hydroperoxide reductase subunit AhpC|uniref:hypothetical protein n=1 Tax=Candidatus Thalassolituus haligoni TaxID=3100113 RepID=UPI003518D717|tara:strand:- start:5967 stop:6341 length:375 start_codon:yes stop_codon:yes gene_type:complete
MKLMPHELRDTIIRPTLDYLGCYTGTAENLLIALAQRQEHSQVNAFEDCSLYPLDADIHQKVWDQYLAFDPDQASLIRGLASQRQFLVNPHSELKTNLCYATAIAWAVFIAYPQVQASDLSQSA